MTSCVPSDPCIQVTSKEAELRDPFGNLRFKVILAPKAESNGIAKTFKVTVLSYCYSEESEPIVLSEEEFCSLKAADDRFNAQAAQYKQLIAAETRGWQDITIYKDKISYHIIDPDCCKVCMHSKLLSPCCKKQFPNIQPKLVCMNPVLRKEVNDFQPIDPHTHDQQYTYHEPRAHDMMTLAPYTQENGICKHFSRKQ